jgi:D-glycero-D-manno-heptose 1,7-bisphosphate phosphatase
MKRRFVLLDRDGTIVEERDYLSDPKDLRLLPGAAAALRELQRLGLGLVVITNQSGVGRGYFDESRLQSIHRRLLELLAAEGIQLDGVYFCPHTPDDDCSCRKPKTGLAGKAAVDLGFDLHTSFVIGDKASDIEMGRSCGATTVRVRTGYGAQPGGNEKPRPDYVAEDLPDAARIIRHALAAEPQ